MATGSEKADGAGEAQGRMRWQQDAGGRNAAHLKDTAAADGLAKRVRPSIGC